MIALHIVQILITSTVLPTNCPTVLMRWESIHQWGKSRNLFVQREREHIISPRFLYCATLFEVYSGWGGGGRGRTPIFEGTLCTAFKTPIFSSLLIQRPLKICTLMQRPRVYFLSFWSKIINLLPNDPIFFFSFFFPNINKFVQIIQNFSQNSIKICNKKKKKKEKKLFGISSKDPLFMLKSHFSPKDPSFLWFLTHKMPLTLTIGAVHPHFI